MSHTFKTTVRGLTLTSYCCGKSRSPRTTRCLQIDNEAGEFITGISPAAAQELIDALTAWLAVEGVYHG